MKEWNKLSLMKLFETKMQNVRESFEEPRSEWGLSWIWFDFEEDKWTAQSKSEHLEIRVEKQPLNAQQKSLLYCRYWK